ncbi:hypothetical protein [Litorimonas sp. WD9-15]|uniref:hypothetical protein n=1 Tax=Litorimonas sp. WD9-15 TaxID=3418716 RepID=UPI003D017743
MKDAPQNDLPADRWPDSPVHDRRGNWIWPGLKVNVSGVRVPLPPAPMPAANWRLKRSLRRKEPPRQGTARRARLGRAVKAKDEVQVNWLAAGIPHHGAREMARRKAKLAKTSQG